ncbi:Uncharacterized protein APZ42_017209 [Daphnia magna]|uniref:Major facilitator superfamily (MFS) profile domain-containing protein n=1 Tax=Daphnia magna TaxID=35525 RepID=A0A164ZQE4_9CRUS|nr:Uncharacterized protein APZ42_017209 [Daphnia magna]
MSEAMVNYTAIPHTNITTAEECGHPEAAVSEVTQKDGEFVWDEKIQSLVSVSFFWGYIITQLIGGRIAERFGTRYMFAVAQMTAGLVTICLPVLARAGTEYFVAGRILLGLAQPLVAKWAPTGERSSISTFIFSGAQIGTVLGITFSGLIADFLGWEAVFYIQGSLAAVVVGMWLYVVYDSPELHPRISAKEKDYIRSSTFTSSSKTLAVPWMSIATSIPCWALLVATLGNNWAFYMLITQLPIYMKTILHFDMKSNALLSALPYLVMWILSLLVAQFADLTARRGWATTNVIRKTANTIAKLGPALCLLMVSFTGCDRLSTLVLLVMAVGLQGAVFSGFLINHLDVAPYFSGTIYGIISGLASVNSWLAPLVVASLTEAQQTVAQWRIAFLLCSSILVIDAFVFLLFGSTERQPWDKEQETN